MNKFRKLGFVNYDGGLEVHSSLLNVVLHDEPLTIRKSEQYCTDSGRTILYT